MVDDKILMTTSPIKGLYDRIGYLNKQVRENKKYDSKVPSFDGTEEDYINYINYNKKREIIDLFIIIIIFFIIFIFFRCKR